MSAFDVTALGRSLSSDHEPHRPKPMLDVEDVQMDPGPEVLIGIYVAQTRNAIAATAGDRDGEVRFIGEVDASTGCIDNIFPSVCGVR